MSVRNSALTHTADVERNTGDNQQQSLKDETPHDESSQAEEEQVLTYRQLPNHGSSLCVSELQSSEQQGGENYENLTNCIITQETDGGELSVQKGEFQETRV